MERKGFTLIELMIVVLVIGILAAVGIPKYQSFVMESRQRSCMSQLKSVDQAIAVWETKHVSIDFTDVVDMQLSPAGIPTGRAYLKNGTWLNSTQWFGLIPDADQLQAIVKDQKVFICPEVLTHYGTPAAVAAEAAANLWQITYRFFKVSATDPLNYGWGYVPTNIGRAVTCYAFGYDNWGGVAQPTNIWLGVGSNQFPPGCGGPDRTRQTLHLQWMSQ